MKRSILGLTEKITFVGKKKEKTVIARIDTGAMGSSLDKALVEELELGPVIKKKIIRQASGQQTRDVIQAKVILHNQYFNVSFTVTDRKHMKYPVLIGQRILKQGDFLIDPKKK